MFASRSRIKPLAEENANVIQRKNNSSKSVRRAFADRPVNQNQETEKPQKKPFSISQPRETHRSIPTAKKTQYLSDYEDVCTKKEANNDWDLIPEMPKLTRKIPSPPTPPRSLPPIDPQEITTNNDFLFEIPRDDSFGGWEIDETEQR